MLERDRTSGDIRFARKRPTGESSPDYQAHRGQAQRPRETSILLTTNRELTIKPMNQTTRKALAKTVKQYRRMYLPCDFKSSKHRNTFCTGHAYEFHQLTCYPARQR